MQVRLWRLERANENALVLSKICAVFEHQLLAPLKLRTGVDGRYVWRIKDVHAAFKAGNLVRDHLEAYTRLLGYTQFRSMDLADLFHVVKTENYLPTEAFAGVTEAIAQIIVDHTDFERYDAIHDTGLYSNEYARRIMTAVLRLVVHTMGHQAGFLNGTPRNP